jgi:galactokinase/mevalonate kinase-like predicted kinase
VRLYRRRLLESLYSNRPAMDAVATIHIDYLTEGQSPQALRRSVKLDQIVWARSPVRLDIAGGWTDTPPFTLREGGEVVNVAVNLNEQPPIQVFCRPTGEPHIRIHSIDLGVNQTISTFDQLTDYEGPGSPFALPKAAIHILGLTLERTGGKSMAAALERVGGGFELSLLSAVPKGSGLGTSSILAATILGALERFFGLKVDRKDLFRQVLQVEQILTTGGGWQDQIGGVAGGVKYISSSPGLRPDPVVYQLDPFLFTDAECCSRFSLYYTGITRLAKNILQDVVRRANCLEPAYLFTLRHLKGLAREAREAVSRRDVESLGKVIGQSWEANKLIHPSTTNEEVEALLRDLSGYSDMKLLGAGGGGYALFLSDSARDAQRLRDRLSAMNHERARLVEMSVNPQGLQVTVS